MMRKLDYNNVVCPEKFRAMWTRTYYYTAVYSTAYNSASTVVWLLYGI